MTGCVLVAVVLLGSMGGMGGVSGVSGMGCMSCRGRQFHSVFGQKIRRREAKRCEGRRVGWILQSAQVGELARSGTC